MSTELTRAEHLALIYLQRDDQPAHDVMRWTGLDRDGILGLVRRRFIRLRRGKTTGGGVVVPVFCSLTAEGSEALEHHAGVRS